MATISADRDWNKYVKNNPSSNNIKYPIENNIINEPVYTNTNINNILTYVSTGNFVNIVSKQFFKKDRSKYANVRVNGVTGYLRATVIRKPTGLNPSYSVEKRVLDMTNNEIQNLCERAGIGRNNREGIDILSPDGRLISGVTKLEKADGRIHGKDPKSDFVFKNNADNSLFFISHKNGSGAGAFRQYGGISEKAGSSEFPTKIYENIEVQSFLNRLYQLYSDATSGQSQIANNPFDSKGSLKRSVHSFVNNSMLVNMAVYGADYGGSRSLNNVDIIGQGDFIFRPFTGDSEDVIYNLSFSGGYHINGDISKFVDDGSGYRAVLLAVPKSDRSTKTPSGSIPLVRTGIYPKAFRTGSIDVYTLT